MHTNRELWYDRPAACWEEALPLGNGRLGTMLYSGIAEDTILLNEDTLWSGYPKDTGIGDAVSHYRRARDLALAGKYQESQEEIESHLLGEFTDAYLPAFSASTPVTAPMPLPTSSTFALLSMGSQETIFSRCGDRW